MKTTIGALLAAFVLSAAAAPAQGAEVFDGVFAHDVNLGISVCCYEMARICSSAFAPTPSSHGTGLATCVSTPWVR